MKRSKSVKLFILGAASLIMAGCGEEDKPQQASVFKDVGDCVSSKLMTEDQCKSAFETAAKEHEKSAPKFNSRELCEKEYGAGQCSPKPNGSGGDSFSPFMTGFLAAQMMNAVSDINRSDCRNDNSCYRSTLVPQPLYRSSSDYSSYRTATNYKVGDVNATTRTVTVKPSVVNTSVKSTGGFGTQSAARSSWGGAKMSSGG